MEIEHDPSVTPASKKSTINQLNLAANVPCCCAIRSSNQSISAGAVTAIQFNAADEFDTDSMHDPSSNNTKITVNTAGVYLLTGSMAMDARRREVQDAIETLSLGFMRFRDDDDDDNDDDWN